MDKLKRKYSFYRALKTISYLIGFPLMTLLIYLSSQSFVGESAFGTTAWYGVLAAVAVWALATLLQIGFSFLVKGQRARIALVLIVSILLPLGAAIGFDFYAESKIAQVQEEYKDKDAEIKDYTYQVNWFMPLTSNRKGLAEKFNGRVSKFTSVYNIKFKSKVYGDENTDLSEYTYNKEDDAYYSANGMLADGYIFGVKKALDILITYNETQAYYKSINKNADTELAAALAALESNPNSDWNKYKLTDEYKAAYGANGEAYKYMLTLDRLDLILSALGRELEPGLSGISTLLGLIGMSEYQALLAYINEDLDVATIVTILNNLNLFTPAITADDLMDLLSGLSFYQSPQAKPIFEFIADKRLREYAYADYYGTVHGAKVGSVLISDSQIGEVTMNTSGYPASYAYSLKQLYQMRADLEYIPTLYPLMAARRYMYMFAGIIGLSVVLAYHFANKEKAAFDELLNGGK